MNVSGRTTRQRDFRRRYGDQIADIVQSHAAGREPPASRPAAHDIKAALQSIVADAAAADLAGLDPLTRALLMDPAWRRLRAASLSALTRAQLADCAQLALDHFPPLGRPRVARSEVTMTLSLLAAARAWHAARRIHLVREALSLAFQADYRRGTAIIRQAHRELHAGAVMPG